MDTRLKPEEVVFFREAIRLAEQAEREGNLPIGAVLSLDGKIIARGRNSIRQPAQQLTRHAEIEALRSVDPGLWPRSREMSLYTTLEPCVMCAGAALLHQLGRIVFGSSDPNGGGSSCLDSLPPYFRLELSQVQWIGPAFPEECDALYLRVEEIERKR